MTPSSQPELFILEPEPVPTAEEGTGLFAQLVFNRPLTQLFTYRVPDNLADSIAVGKRVQVPFGKGNKPLAGYCVELSRAKPERRVKAIEKVLDEEPIITPLLLQLTRWMAEYYLCGWGQALDAVVPAGAKEGAGTRARLFVEAVPEDQVPSPTPKVSRKQWEALVLLRQEGKPLEAKRLARAAGCGLAVLWGLVKHGLARKVRQRIESFQPPPQVTTEDVETPTVLTLNDAQKAALAPIKLALAENKFQPFLLYGITGSGKTEIYLQAIEQVVAQGKEALVLVPEISLTPQTIARFQGRFPRVAILHSHLTAAERGHHWRRIATGQVQVIVGARSAVFAPTRKLGLIVIDEEHESSFKQESTPRYHARDLAMVRAKMEGIPIVLGSATPALESWNNAQKGQYQLLTLPHRVENRPLPHVQLIDLRTEATHSGRFRAISPTLERAMREALAQGGQVILLLNRRGFDTYLFCPRCGHVVKCKFCDVSLTHHRPLSPTKAVLSSELAVLGQQPPALDVAPSSMSAALCHYCGFETQPPSRCPACQQSFIRYLGLGTEKLDAEITQKFPGITAQRMDSDTMRRVGSHARVLEAFQRGDIRILFGTQMIAKGLDFPNVTLVGVVMADIALHLPDFRSGERTFQLLAQVAGRTGRGTRGGRVLVQTFNPEASCIALAAKHDYITFATQELQQRQQFGYPPFQRMARVIVRSRDEAAAVIFAAQLADTLRRDLPAEVRLLGPAEAPIKRLEGYHRFHFQLQSKKVSALHEVLRRALAAAKPPKGVEATVDIDPLSML